MFRIRLLLGCLAQVRGRVEMTSVSYLSAAQCALSDAALRVRRVGFRGRWLRGVEPRGYVAVGVS